MLSWHESRHVYLACNHNMAVGVKKDEFHIEMARDGKWTDRSYITLRNRWTGMIVSHLESRVIATGIFFAWEDYSPSEGKSGASATTS